MLQVFRNAEEMQQNKTDITKEKKITSCEIGTMNGEKHHLTIDKQVSLRHIDL